MIMLVTASENIQVHILKLATLSGRSALVHGIPNSGAGVVK